LGEQIESGDQRKKSKTVKDEDRYPALDTQKQVDQAGQKRKTNDAI
jgi:hypothetical protein